MSKSKIDIQVCESILAKEWEQVSKETKPEKLDIKIEDAVKRSINCDTKTYRYVLPTHILAKLVEPSIDCRAIQAASTLPGSYDARSVCHKVIVPFDKLHENVLGGSTEPYVNNPLRVPQVTEQYAGQQKDRKGWSDLCYVLAEVQNKNDPAFTKKVLGKF